MDAVENRKEVGEFQFLEESGGKIIMEVCWKKGGSLKQKSNQTWFMKVLILLAYRGKIIKQETHINTLYFYLLPSAISFYDVLKSFLRIEVIIKHMIFLLTIHEYFFHASAILKCKRVRNI